MNAVVVENENASNIRAFIASREWLSGCCPEEDDHAGRDLVTNLAWEYQLRDRGMLWTVAECAQVACYLSTVIRRREPGIVDWESADCGETLVLCDLRSSLVDADCQAHGSAIPAAMSDANAVLM